MTQTPPLTRLAKRLSFERVPETCPAVHTAGVKAIADFSGWVLRQSWSHRLSRKEITSLETRFGDLVADVMEAAKDGGTRPLRAAFVREIEDRLRLHMSEADIARVEAGEDPERLLPDTNEHSSVRLYDTPRHAAELR